MLATNTLNEFKKILNTEIEILAHYLMLVGNVRDQSTNYDYESLKDTLAKLEVVEQQVKDIEKFKKANLVELRAGIHSHPDLHINDIVKALPMGIREEVEPLVVKVRVLLLKCRAQAKSLAYLIETKQTLINELVQSAKKPSGTYTKHKADRSYQESRPIWVSKEL